MTKYHAKRVFECPTHGVVSRYKEGRQILCPRCREPVTVFDSQREYARLLELRDLTHKGHIRDLELQPVFPLVVEGVRVGEYRADFRYVEGNGQVVEDVKGAQTPVFKLKRALVRALYGIEVTLT